MATLAASLISAGLATIITAHVVEKQMLKEFDERLERELEASVTFLEETGKAEATEEYEQHREVFGTKFDLTKPSPDEVLNKNQKVRYDAVVKGEGYSYHSDDKPPEGEIEMAEELGEIHAISTDEFMENESGYLQSTMTYFADGGVLDEDNELVVDFEDMIGTARPPFGELSGEPHIVYLRNTRLRREFEVIEDDANAADILAEPGTGVGA